MPLTPGRPHSPTLHPRTRPEANDNAMKMRGTNDWFRHDGKNTETWNQPAARLAGKPAEDCAEKNKGDPKQWFQHNGAPSAEPARPPSRCPTAESRQYHDKIYGRDEAWYKHEENRDYVSPRPAHRLPNHGGSAAIKEKRTKADTMNWYKHEHGAGESHTPSPPKHRTPSKSAEVNQRMMKGGGGTPDWFAHDGKPAQPEQQNGGAGRDPPSGAAENGRHGNGYRVTAGTSAEGYQERNRQGSAADWFQHSANASAAPVRCQSPRRVGSREGEENAQRLGRESESWFDHDVNKNYSAPRPAVKGASAVTSQSRGADMEQILTMTKADGSPSVSAAEARIKPEAQEIARKNIRGLMDKYLSQEPSGDYRSPRPAPRVKPEASETAAKSKGVMGDCMGGYPDAPVKKDANRVKPEAQGFAARNKGTAGKVIQGDLPASARKAGGGRGVKPEAEGNARRNQGTLKDMMDNYGDLSIAGKPAARLNTTLAKEIAEKNKGTLELKW